jgi:8-oxo-dGTP diphosphatase
MPTIARCDSRWRPDPAPGDHGPVSFRVVPAAYVLLTDADGRVLLQLRANTGFRDGFWAAAAAGHVERGESVHAAACREAAEELGVAIAAADLVPLTVMHRTNATGLEIDERVDFFFTCRRWTGEPRTREPDKSAGLRWYALDALPDPVVPHELSVLDGLRTGRLSPIVAFGF